MRHRITLIQRKCARRQRQTFEHPILSGTIYLSRVRRYPASLRYFVFSAIVFVLQLFPIPFGFLMFLIAPAWSIFLINAGMIGTAVEVFKGQVLRKWLLLPATFYFGYLGFAAADHLTLKQSFARFDAANSSVNLAFNPDRQSLVFEGEPVTVRDFVPQQAGTVVWWRYPKNRPQFGFERRPSGDACKVAIRGMGARVCQLDRDQQPPLPAVTVVRKEEQTREGTLPVQLYTTTVTTPDGKRHILREGFAHPLRWFPMPVMGCGLISAGTPSWECFAGFERDRFLPIGAGASNDCGNSRVLAKALGLRSDGKSTIP